MTPAPSPRTRQRFEPDAYNQAEHAVLACIRHKSQNLEIRTYRRLAELTGLSEDVAEKTAQKLVNRRAIRVVPIYEGVERSPLEFVAVPSDGGDVLPPGTIRNAR